MQADLLQQVIKESHKQGIDVPHKIKQQLKNSPIGQQLEIDNKMSLREKQKAK